MSNWITETEAAKKMGRAPITLRRYAKKGTWPIAFTAVNNRRFMYSARDIEKLLNEHSSKNGSHHR